MPNVGLLSAEVEAHFREHPHDLDIERIEVRPVLNWGGFVNQSFTITDGRSKLHLKISDDLSQHEKFRRWLLLGKLLEERYHAPPLIGEWVLAGTGFRGLLFHHLDESKRGGAGTLGDEVLDCLQRLHRDQELHRALQRDRARTCLDDMLSNHGERFTEDLNFVRGERPSFVSEERLVWMEEEAQRVIALARSSAAFGAPADRPIHGDLWWGNLLAGSGGRWYLLDWDELRLGDPALDIATSLAPSLQTWMAGAWRRWSAEIGDQAFSQRVDLLQRAHLLDWIIDPLADYICARSTLAAPAAFRAEKKRVHGQALRAYQQAYGTSR
jgi:hypothetical protein